MKKVIVAVIIVVGIALAFFAFRPKEKEVVKYDSFEVKKGEHDHGNGNDRTDHASGGGNPSIWDDRPYLRGL